MLYDRLENLEQYTGLFENLDTCIAWLQENDVEALPLGRTDIDGDKVYVNVTEATAKPAEEMHFETHTRYMDLQVDLSGSELFQVALGALHEEKAYDKEADCALFSADVSIAGVLGEGRFVVFMTEEPHKPTILSADGALVKKAVFKIAR